MLADMARMVLIAQTEERLERHLPQKRHARNFQRTLLQIEDRERLEKMGHDPALARHVEEAAVAALAPAQSPWEAFRDARAKF